MTFISVTGITNFSPTQMVVGTEYELTATVQPSNATNRAIEWSIKSGGEFVENGRLRVQSGTPNRYFLKPINSGNIVVTATIRNGAQT